ncbi:MAG: SUMF1/EgtB/PvdO family nonheme iron enzyme [Desulfobacter sp.]|nr:MAG: SUMF1/EgtB/PvdO family nonheme iron enzyme [Desulfobacter sp.]
MTEEAKTSLLHSFTDAVKTGDIDLAKATDILKAVTDFLDEIDITATQDQSLDIIEEIKKVLSRLGGHILEGDAEEDIEEVEIDEDEDIEEVELDEDEEIEEIDDEPIDEDLDIEEIELDEDEDIEEIELDEDEEIEEVELDEDEELEEVDEDLLDEDDIEEVELDEDEDIEEIELDEDEELEEIDDELMDEDQDLEEIELDEDEELEEVDEDLLDEDDIEEVELDEDEDIEEIELDDDEELEEIDDELMDEDQDLEEIELDEDEELEEADEDLLDENDIEEVELDEDEDIEEIELDEDEELDEIEELDIDEDEEVEEIQLDENEELEEVDELDEEELDALEEFRKARELAEHFDDSLGDREKKFNAYVKIPQGIYTVGTRKSLKTSLELQQFEMPLVYIGKFPVTNALFEIFIEQTGYLTTAEKKGYGVVYHARYQKKGNRSSWRKQAGFRDVKGACWYQPDGPGSSLHDKRNHPVVQVSVEDALAYASWIGRRLPTEAEWEAAARTDLGFKYPWGSTFNPKALNIEQTGFSATCAVDTFEAHANEFGMSDILGNVMEWTTDRQYPPVNTKGNQKYNVAKGGAWNATESVTISSRGLFKQDFTANTIGFRCISELFQ